MIDWSTHPYPHFHPASDPKLACPCCGRCDMDPGQMDAMEWLRAWLDRPLIITSGFRCPGHNADPKVGGAKNSPHMRGLACDIQVVGGVQRAEMVGAAFKPDSPFVGIGPAKKFVHLDTWMRPDAMHRRVLFTYD